MTRAKDRKNANVAVQQYTKTAAHLDQLGEQARKLRQELADATDAVADTREELKGYNERRREQTAKLKEILTPVVEHLQSGGTANGVTGLHNWAAWYNPTAKDGKNAARQIMRIVNSPEPSEKKGDIKSPIHLNLDKLAKEMEGGRKVMVTCGNFKYELMKTPFLHTTTITLNIADTRSNEVVAKKQEEKKPVKHAKNPDTYQTWCRMRITNGNTAHQQRHATCPYCIAAMEAKIPVNHPESDRRWLKQQIAEIEDVIPNLQSRLDLCLPEYRTPEWESNLKERIVSYNADLERWKKQLAELPTTPKEAVAAAIAKREKAVDRELTYQVEQAEGHAADDGAVKVKVKLTPAQAREVSELELPSTVAKIGNRLEFHGNYEEDAKVLVLKLEERIESLNKESAALIDANRDLYFESDMGASEAARQIKGQVAKINGAAKACDAAMEAIAYGSLDDEHNILQWYEERKDARHGWITQEASEVAINALLGCVPKDATLEEATAAFEKFTTLRNDHPEWHPYVTANWSETLRKLVRDLTPETEEVM